jgi:hypothetical protein
MRLDSTVFGDRFVEAIGWLKSAVQAAKDPTRAAADKDEDPSAYAEMVYESEWMVRQLERLVDGTRPPAGKPRPPAGNEVPL